MLAVTVNDKPLTVSAIVERGRVLLPMRATFAALGVSISYDGDHRLIMARSATHDLLLPLDERSAIVDGKAVTLDVPARVVANRTYVPLRFVAQAMGASVGYDSRAQLVSIASPIVAISSQVGTAVRVSGIDPPDGATVSTAYPTVSARLLGDSADSRSVSLSIDDEDVTSLATFDGSTITFMPRRGLSRGSHRIVFRGRTLHGRDFSSQWSFETSLAAPPDAGPAMYSDYDYRFYVNGLNTYYPGDYMHFVLNAPPGGSAVLQLCNLGYQYPLWNGGYGSTYEAAVLAPSGYWLPECEVTAIYTSWSGARTYVPIPVYVGLYTNPIAGSPGTPNNMAPGAPRQLPHSPRRPEPTLVPMPMPAPHRVAPIVVPKPVPAPPVIPAAPHAVPSSHPIPVPVPVPHPRASMHPVL